MNLPINPIDFRTLRFENLEPDPCFGNQTYARLEFQHDLELIAQQEWLVHLDIIFTEPAVARIMTRTIFEVSGTFESLWSAACCNLYIEHALEFSKQAFNKSCKQERIFCRIEKIGSSNYMQEYFHAFQRDINKYRLYLSEKPESYQWNSFEIMPTDQSRLIATITLLVIEALFFDQELFNPGNNKEQLLQIIPLRYCTTVKLKLQRLDEIKAVYLSQKQLFFYVLMIRCTCTLLLTSQYHQIEQRLQQLGFTEGLFKEFIQSASAFLDSVTLQLPELSHTIGREDEFIDWAHLVS